MGFLESLCGCVPMKEGTRVCADLAATMLWPRISELVVVGFHDPGFIAIPIPFFHACALVVQFFTGRQRDLEFDVITFSINS